jgi:hypothetical protein
MQVAVPAILPPVWHQPAPRRLVQVAIAAPLASHLSEQKRPASQYRQELDLLQHCDSAQELCARHLIGVAGAAEPPELPAWQQPQRNYPSAE